MSVLSLSVRQLRYEQRVFWRTPATVFFTVAMPVMLLAIFASLNHGQQLDAVRSAPFADYFVPGMVAFAIASTCYGNVAVRIVFRREAGLLRRIRTTPLPTTSLLAGYITNAVVTAGITVIVLTIIGHTTFDVPIPEHIPLLIFSVALGATCLSALGLAVSTFILRMDAADAVIFGTLLPAMFISGAFQPVAADSTIGRVSTLLPFRHLLAINLTAFGTIDDHRLLVHVAVLAAWGIVGVVVTLRRFTWQPRPA